MADTTVSASTAASSWQTGSAAQAQEKTNTSLSIYEKMRDAREKAQATRDQFKNAGKSPSRYSDLPILAHAKLARARNSAQVNAAAGYARRQIAYLRGAKRTDPDNAKRIQAAINQLQKAVNRAGKKNRDLEREKVSETRRKNLMKEKKLRAAQREKQELRRKQTMRMMRESGYIQESEIDKRMQSHIASVDIKLREQLQSIASTYQPSAGVVAQQYAADTAALDAPETVLGAEIDVEA